MRRDVGEEHGYGRTLIERRALPSGTSPPAPRTRPPALPPLPAAAAERALALERFAADVVGQLGAAGARFLAALLDEQAAEADAHR